MDVVGSAGIAGFGASAPIGLPVSRIPFDPEGADRPLDVLEREFTQRMELGLEPAFDRFADGARDDDATGRGLGFEAGRHVHAIAVEVFAFHDQIAEVQADPEHDARVFRLVAVGFSHGLLECDSGAERIHGAWELGQRTIAGQLDQPAAVPGQCRLEPLLAVLPQARKRAALVPPHQAGVADDIGRNDCC